MKLRNKKTGSLGELKDFINDGFIVKVSDGIGVAGYKYDSLTLLNEEWEDYKPSLIDITSDKEIMDRVLKKSAEMQEETLKKIEEEE